MSALDLAGKRVLIREDLNAPVADGSVTSDARLRAAVPTIRMALDAGAAVILVSHRGRPEEGKPDAKWSLAPIAARLQDLLGIPVRLAAQWLDGVEVAPGAVVLCENVRFQRGEKSNSPELARRMAALADVFVLDAFGTAHRAHASTAGLAACAKTACAGPLLLGEMDALAKAFRNPQRPMVAIVGGAKVSSKLNVLNALLDKVDRLIVGGGIANTFIAAAGHRVGKSLYEAELVPTARALLGKARQAGCNIPIPTDVVVTREFSASASAQTKPVQALAETDMILDLGPDSAAAVARGLDAAATILWNGPLGVFEFPACADATRTLAQAIAASSAYSVAGGGDTLAAIERFGVGDQISYISTGGGAFLEYLEGKTLPAVAALEQRAA